MIKFARPALSRCALLLAAAALAAGAAWGAAEPPVAPPAGSGGADTAKADPAKKDSGTADILVFLKPGTDPVQFAKDHGLQLKQSLISDPDAHIFSAASLDEAKKAHARVKVDASVRAAALSQPRRHHRLGFVPNDPYFHKHTPTSSFPGEWHLVNEFTPGLDAGVQGPWSRDITGQGVTLAVVDDCLQTDHPDLAPNYVAADSHDFADGDPDPSPKYTDDHHGICCAGIAAARGGNGIGVTGAAPFASLAGLRIDYTKNDSTQFADATLYHSNGANTQIKIKNHSYGGDIYIPSDAEHMALAVSTQAGTIHCFAAGNETSDANKQDPNNSPDAICVAAMGSDGIYADYSNFGACVMVAAPSSSDNSPGLFSITTTDNTGDAGNNSAGTNDVTSDPFPDTDYTSTFSGTSAATPVVTGVLALVKQVQPRLNTRFAKHLMVRASTIIDAGDTTTASDGGWKTNAAGNKFNQNYGFGLINADLLTKEAVKYSGVTAQTSEDTGTVNVDAAIPDNNTTGVSRQFSISAATPLEEVLVALDITHPYRGDVEVYLTSPRGTRGRLLIKDYSDTGNDIVWTFSSNTFWGENPSGLWTLTVADRSAGDIGIWNSYSATMLMGQLIPKTSQSISFAALSDQPFSPAPFTLSANATSGLPVSFTVVTGSATVAGNTVTLTGVGAVTIRASQPGNLDFNAAPGVSQSFTVTPGGQSIAFTPLKALYSIRTPPFALSATATSGLPVAFSIVTGSATVSGSAITITGPGTITVRASQAGNTLYNPAPNADQTFHAVDNDPPEFSSPPQASASSAGAGQAVTFTAAASDPNNDPLIYSWAFDDGFIGGGAAVTHAFATAGTHSATLTVTDSAGFVIMSSVTLETLPPLYLTGNADDTGIDSDGDRFSDAFEAAAGSDPADGAQTPFDNHGPGTPPRPLPAGSALSIKLNFIKQFSDSLQLKGTLPLSSAGLPLTGHKVVVDIDGVLSAFTLDIKGKSAKSATAGFVISAKPGNGFSKFTLKISKSSLAAIYAKDGLTKTASPDTAAHMLVTILFNNGGYQGTENLLFTQTKGASGKTKQLQ